MKKLIILSIALFGLIVTVNAQWNSNGTPDMRYKQNKEMYGNSYSTPSINSYNNNSNLNSGFKQETYTNPYTNSQSNYPSYPTKSNGTPDMRYKENRHTIVH